jgi:hypothetical protein
MNEKYEAPMVITGSIAYVGLLFWLVSFIMSWGVALEAVFLGFCLGGLFSGALIGLSRSPDFQGSCSCSCKKITEEGDGA